MLVAVAGFSGAGKSTAISYLENRGFGTRYYAGSIVREEIERRRIALTPDNEKLVRAELRSRFGMAVFAERALPYLLRHCATGHVFLDALYSPAERDFYLQHFANRLMILAITASIETRCAHLADRPDRPLSLEKLVRRDAFEREKLGLDEIIAGSDRSIENEGSLKEFEQALDAFSRSLG